MAGIKAINEKGVDHVSVSDVAKISGVSRPTFYTYFGDIPGFYAEIWLKHGLNWLNKQLEMNAKIDPQFNLAMLEIFAISRREPELQEVVQPDVQSWWSKVSAEGKPQALRLVWTLGFKLGYLLTERVSDKVKLGLPASKLLCFPDNVLDLPVMQGLGEFDPKTVPPMSGLQGSSNSVDEALTRSAMEVVASSGFAATSMTRIARKARVSTGSVYPRFKSAEQLIEKSFDEAISEIIAKNIDVVNQQGIGADQYALSVNAGYGLERATWRNYRTEMHLEAVHNRELAKFMEPGLEETAKFLKDNFMSFGAPAEISESVAWFMHSHAIGSTLIFNQIPEVADQDNRIMTRWIISQLPK